MVNNLPGSEDLDIRDYLYIDRQRVGSLLAQLVDGLPSERSEVKSRSRKLGLAIRSVAEVSKELGDSGSQTLALADLHVSQLEEAAEALGILGDVSDKMRRRKFWLRGRVRSEIRPGMLFRVNAPTQVSDIASITAAFGKLTSVLSNSDQVDLMSKMQTIFDALYGESITVAVRTAEDVDDFEVGFVGEIPHSHEFGPMRRNLLLSQVGATATTLTTIMQVSAIPTEQDSPRRYEDIFAQIKPKVDQMLTGNSIDRSVLDQLVTALGGVLAATGFVAAPRWPSIGMIPLAIYRTIETTPDLDSESS